MEGDSRGFFAYQVAVDGGSHLAVLGRLYLSTPVFEPELGFNDSLLLPLYVSLE